MRPARGFILPLVIVLIASVAILTVVVFWQLKPKPQTPITKRETQNQSATQPSSTDPTANWKTYTFKNISFRYPQNYELNDKDGENPTNAALPVFRDISISNGKESLFIDVSANGSVALEEGYDSSKEGAVIDIAGYKTKSIIYMSKDKKFPTLVTLETFGLDKLPDGVTIRYTFFNTETESIFKSILSTFKFTDQNLSAKTLGSFADSKGVQKYIISSHKIKDGLDDTIVYLSKSQTVDDTSIELVDTGIAGLDTVFVSHNTDTKYFTFVVQFADLQDIYLFDENAKQIKIDLSRMGFGTIIPGQYGKHFGQWQDTSTNFTIIGDSANGHTYEGIFDATTGKQIRDTKQIK